MKISTRLRLAVYIPALMALVIIAALVFSYQDMGKTQENGATVRQIRSSITELNHTAFSYILYHEERPKQQFLAEHDVLTQLIAIAQFQSPDQQRLLDGIRADSVTMKDLFLQLVSSYERGSTAGMDELRGAEDRLVGLLLLRSYEADADAALLRSLVDDGIRITEIRTIGLIFLVIVLATVPLTIILARTRRGITSSLSNLSKGAAVIGSGNLDFRIEEKRNDEIGDLSRAFNRMTTDLKTITASKTDLEREFDKRKKAEETLQKEHDELEQRVQERTRELREANKILEAEVAKRKQAEAVVNTERQRFNEALDMLPAYLVLLSPDYHVPFANHFFRERFGESHGQRCFEYLFRRSEPCEICETYKVLKTMKPLEWEWTGPDGRNYYVFDFPFTDTDGSTLIMEVGIDITERKRAEAALQKAHDELELRVQERTTELKESRDKYQRILDMAHEGICMTDPEGNITFVNRRMTEMYGFTEAELLGKSALMLVDETEKARAQSIIESRKKGIPLGFEMKLRRKDGTALWILGSASLIFDEQGRHVGNLVMHVDITELKETEEKANQIAEEWQTTFDSIADLVSIQDANFKLVRVNKAYADAVKMRPEELTGRNCYAVVHGTTCPIADCPHEQTLKTKQTTTREIFEPHLGIYLEVSASPIFSANGEILGSVHIAKDVTERKQAEEGLRQRTAELEASNKELEAFSYSVSHDLRAPLRSMEGFSQALVEDYGDKLDEKGKEFLKYVQDSSQLMAELIDDLLKISRVTRQEMYFDTVNLSDIAQSVVVNLNNTEPERTVALTITPNIKCYGDARLLHIVLKNLIGNAWKFTSKVASPRIEVGVTERDGQTTYFVRDNGAGFDMAYVDKLFQPFQRLHKSTEFPGTGIGLATVQRIIRRHGGQVWAEGKVGQGATFYFTLR